MENNFNLVTKTTPFNMSSKTVAMPEGLSVRHLVNGTVRKDFQQESIHVSVNGKLIDRNDWDSCFPRANDIVTLNIVPTGGGDGGKNPLATILQIVVMAAAMWVTMGHASVALGLAETATMTFGTAMAGAAIGIVGNMLINAIIPPATVNSSSSTSDESPLAIGPSNNSSGAGNVIPKIFGRHKINPYYGAKPYTELVGEDQYLRMLFVLGYGPLQVDRSSLKLGDTDLVDFTSQLDADEFTCIIHEGYEHEDLKIYPAVVDEDSIGSTLFANTPIISTTTEDVDEISAEIYFQSGLVEFDDSGDKQNRTVNFTLEYRKHDSGDVWTSWAYVAKLTADSSITCSEKPGELRYITGEQETDGGGTYYTYGYLPGYNHGAIFIDNSGYLQKWYTTTSDSTYTGDYPTNLGTMLCKYTQYYTSSNITSITDTRPSGTTGLVPSYSGNTIYITAGELDSEVNDTSITAKKAAMLRYGFNLKLAEKAQYDIRITRTTADTDDDKIYDEATWAVLRSIQTGVSPINTDILEEPLAMVEMRIKATDILNGVIDNFNCIATSVLNTWNGSSWIKSPTDNPAYIYLDILQGAGMKEPLADSRIDLETIKEWAAECVDKDYRFNGVLDSKTTVYEALKLCAAVGRASFSLTDGLYSVIRDSGSAGEAGIKQWLTPRNSWNVSGSRAYDEVHALEFTYVDESNDYEQNTDIVYVNGYGPADVPAEGIIKATRIDTIDLYGITNFNQAWNQSNYYLGVVTNRPEMHSRTVDVEHLVCTRGDLIRVTDDISLHGITAARILEVLVDGSTVTGIVIDEKVSMEIGTDYGVRIRYTNAPSTSQEIRENLVEVTSNIIDTQTLTFETPLAIGDTPSIGDLVMFGEASQETADKLVHHIEMGDNLTATIYYVDAATELWGDNWDNLPPYDTNITKPFDPTRAVPAVPAALSFRSDETVAYYSQEDGTYINRVQINVLAGKDGDIATAQLECQYKLTDVDENHTSFPLAQTSTSSVFFIDNVKAGIDYTVRTRAISKYGVVSPWLVETHTVEGRTSSVGAVTNLVVKNCLSTDPTYTNFNFKDCIITWDYTDTLWNGAQYIKHYLVEVYDSTYTTKVYEEKVTDTLFNFSFDKNYTAFSGTPARTFIVDVTVVTVFGEESETISITPINPQVTAVSGVDKVEHFGAATVSWTDIGDEDLAGYLVFVDDTADFTPSLATNLYAKVGASTNSISIDIPSDGTYYVQVAAYDMYGTDDLNFSDLGTEFTIDSTISATNLLDFAEEMSNTYTNTPILQEDTWTNSESDPGVSGYDTLWWNEHSIWYNGTEYVISAGSTTNSYIYWSAEDGAYTTTNDVSIFEALQEDNEDFQIAINYGDSYELGWDSKANMVIGTAKIGLAAIENANIGNIIESTNYNVIPGTVAAGWRLDKSGALVCNDIEVYSADGTLMIDGNTASVAATSVPWSGVSGEGTPADNATVNHTYAQTTAPSSGMVTGDFWIDTDDSNKLYRYSGSGWVLLRDSGITQALQDAANAQDTADGKIDSFYQASAPTSGMSLGDLWFDTDDGNKVYRYNGSSWQTAQDNGIATAISDAATAQDTADGKVTTFFTTSTPTATALGDLWYNSNTYLLKRWDGSSWVTVSNSYTNTDQLTDGAGLGTTSTWAGVTGTGKPADNADVTNYSDYRVSNSQTADAVTTITNPQGASYSSSSSSATGAIVIVLPQSWTSTMMKMEVDVYIYTGTPLSFKAQVGGYNYGSGSWVNEFAQIVGNTAANNRIRFGHNGSKCCIVIGETTSTWPYIKVAVKNFQAGHSNYAISQWDDNWDIILDSTLSGYTFTGDFSDTLLDAKSIIGQGAFATEDEINSSNYGSYIKYLSADAIATGALSGIVVHSPNKTSYNDADQGFYLGADGKFGVGNSSKYMRWDGSSLAIRGTLTADDITSGTLTGRTIQTNDNSPHTSKILISGDTLYVYDASGTVRVKLGEL